MQAAKSFNQRFTEEAFCNLYISDIGIHPSVGLDKTTGEQYESDLEENVRLALRKILNHSFRFTNYRQLLISKGKSDLPREICIPSIRDKLVLGGLSQLLDDVYDTKCKTAQPQLVVDRVKGRVEKECYDSFIKLDIRKFYATIEHVKLMRILRRKIRKKEVLELVSSAISTPSAALGTKVKQPRPKGIPEGLSISNRLANIYLSDIDRSFDSRNDCAYFRYVDDILVLCNNSNLCKIEKAMQKAVKKLSLETNEKKRESGLINVKSFEFLGYCFQPNKQITVKTGSRRNLEKELEKIFRSKDRESNFEYWKWKLNLRITGCKIKNKNNSYERYGWLYYFSRINDLSLVCRLDWLVHKLFARHKIEKPGDIKSFKKSYYEIRYKADSTKYIPSYGADLSTEDKRGMMKDIFKTVKIDDMSDEEVENTFNEKIRREARRLEKDIGLIS